jgi:hypothetical protein
VTCVNAVGHLLGRAPYGLPLGVAARRERFTSLLAIRNATGLESQSVAAWGNRCRSSGSTVFTPITSRYTTIQTSAIADGMVMKVLIFWPVPGARNAASVPTR